MVFHVSQLISRLSVTTADMIYQGHLERLCKAV